MTADRVHLIFTLYRSLKKREPLGKIKTFYVGLGGFIPSLPWNVKMVKLPVHLPGKFLFMALAVYVKSSYTYKI